MFFYVSDFVAYISKNEHLVNALNIINVMRQNVYPKQNEIINFDKKYVLKQKCTYSDFLERIITKSKQLVGSIKSILTINTK